MELANWSGRNSTRQLQWENLHIDWGEGCVGDGAADGAGEGESGVESWTAELLNSLGLDNNWGGGGHCECVCMGERRGYNCR